MNAVRDAIERDEAEVEQDAPGDADDAQDGDAQGDAPGEPPEPPADETPPEGAVGPTQAEAEAIFGKTEKASQAHVRKLAGLLEPLGLSLAPCPLCPEVHVGFIDLADAGRIPEEIVSVVQSFLGVQREADYLPSPTTRGCEACGGLGKVKSGSQVPNYATLTCAECKGTGFVPPPGSVSVAGTAENVMPPDPHANGFTAPTSDADAWGSPRLLDNGLENPNYGKMPQYKSAALP